MNRAEHLAWCKERALAYCDRGEVPNALASIGSDLSKHEETRGHPAIQLMAGMVMMGELRSPTQARKFIEGFR